jgi:DNA-binding NarL/FixJ family response regulator
MTGRDGVRVVLGEDSVLLREGIAGLLEREGLQVVAQAADAEDVLRKVRAHKPDVPEVCVLVLSQYIEEGYATDLLGGGADGVGFMLKDWVEDVDRFVDAVRRVASGGSALDPEVVAHLLGRHREADPIAELSERERETLALMAEGLSNRAIADGLMISEHAVEKHVTSIFSKLDLPQASDHNRRVLAVLAYLRA